MKTRTVCSESYMDHAVLTSILFHLAAYLLTIGPDNVIQPINGIVQNFRDFQLSFKLLLAQVIALIA